MTYRAEIDGIRALAVVLVLGYHAKLPGFDGGFIGVDVFFVLSGYLIAGLLREEIAQPGRFRLGAFLLRRIRRLVPLMLVVGLATAAAGWFVLIPPDYKDFGQSLVLGPLFLGNLLFWHEAGYFGGAAVNKPLLHLWSLGVEGQFYLTMALLGLLAAWRWQVALGLGAALSLASFGLSLIGAWSWPDAAFYLLPFRFWEFAVGCLLIFLPRSLAGAGWAGLAAVLLGAATITGADAFPGVAALLPVLGTAGLLLASGALRRGLAWAPLVWLGKRSYGIYLWHFPLFVLVGAVWPELPLWLLIPPTIALAAASLVWVERPCRRATLRRPTALGLGGLAAASVLVGAVLHLSGGAMVRLPETAQAPLRHHEAWAMPCHDVLWVDAVKAGERCRIGAEGVPPRVAILGDSHAGHLTPALAEVLRARGAAGLVFSRGWCAPVPGFGTAAPTRGPECAGFMEAAWRQIMADPQITHVILSAQWANFTAGTREGLAKVTYGIARQPQDNPRAFDLAMEALALRLSGSGSGRQLLVVEPVPEFPTPVPEALVRAAWTGDRPKAMEPVPYESRNGAAMATLARFGSSTSATIASPVALLCPDGPALCQVADDDGAPFYRDRGHLTSRGAAIVVEGFADWLPSGG